MNIQKNRWENWYIIIYYIIFFLYMYGCFNDATRALLFLIFNYYFKIIKYKCTLVDK